MIKRERKIMDIKTITSVSLKSDKPYRNKYGTDLWAFDIAFSDGSTGIANGASTSPIWAKPDTVVEANDSTYKTKDGSTIWRIKMPKEMNEGQPDADGYKATKTSGGTTTFFNRDVKDKGREIAIQACINQACSAYAQSPDYKSNGYNEAFKSSVYEMAKDLLEIRDAISNGTELAQNENPF
jgi:hypothetical protein